MAASPQFIATPILGTATFSTANTTITGASGSVSTLVTGSATGTRINRVSVWATGNTSAGNIRLFLSADGTQANNRLVYDLPVTAVTAAAGTQQFYGVITFENGLVLPSGATLGVATHNNETFHAVAEGGTF